MPRLRVGDDPPAPDGMPEPLRRFAVDEWSSERDVTSNISFDDPRSVVAYFAVHKYLAARARWFEEHMVVDREEALRLADADQGSWRAGFDAAVREASERHE
jgi:hypothetical protein